MLGRKYNLTVIPGVREDIKGNVDQASVQDDKFEQIPSQPLQ